MTMTTKPKGRQFQVVPVPGKFTRGRWKCWDYREESKKSEDVFDPEREKNLIAALMEQQGQQTSALLADVPASIQTIVDSQDQHHKFSTVSSPIDIATSSHESSTILVTSVAPAKSTPNLGISSSSDTINNSLSDIMGETVVLPVPVQHADNVQRGSSCVSNAASWQSSNPEIHLAATTPSLVQADCDEGASTASAASGGPVAIDNKIEQAMDLVKTHLTFAVREEVDVLRSTIVDLEAKVALLESQNQILKQFAPAEIIANLSKLVANAPSAVQHQTAVLQSEATHTSCAAANAVKVIALSSQMPSGTSSHEPTVPLSVTSLKKHVEETLIGKIKSGVLTGQ